MAVSVAKCRNLRNRRLVQREHKISRFMIYVLTL